MVLESRIQVREIVGFWRVDYAEKGVHEDFGHLPPSADRTKPEYSSLRYLTNEGGDTAT